VRWEIAHVLRGGHANKTLFFLDPSIDVRIRTRLLMEDFSVSAADLASVRILALRLTSPEQPISMFCAKPDRDAYLVSCAWPSNARPFPWLATLRSRDCRAAYFRSLACSSTSSKMTWL
jgi:hypothetical protein